MTRSCACGKRKAGNEPSRRPFDLKARVGGITQSRGWDGLGVGCYGDVSRHGGCATVMAILTSSGPFTSGDHLARNLGESSVGTSVIRFGAGR